MIRRVYGREDGKVAESPKFSIYIYPHPNESGQEKWHVHVVRRSDGCDAKFSLWTYKIMRKTSFDRTTVEYFNVWVYENRHFLRRKWVRNVLIPFRISLGKSRNKNDKET